MPKPLVSSLSTTVCITRREQEDYLCRELLLHSKKLTCKRIAPQVVVISPHEENSLIPTPLFFSGQLLPKAESLHADSINQWAQAIYEKFAVWFVDSPPEWCLHIFDPLTTESGKEYARPIRIREALLALLKQKRRSVLRALRETPGKDTTLVQVAAISPTEGYISLAPPPLRATYGSAISPHLAGHLEIPDDKSPPSRAFKKLREALEIFNLPISRGETAVDLGASPGGWTYVLRAHGLRVTAIDRSPLTDSLMRDSGVTFIQGNALTWTPSAPVDWLVCDVITTPENTASLLRRWVEKKLCRNFCVTVKFKGAPDLATLHDLSLFLLKNTQWFDGRQLTHNKNEVTIVGTTS